MKIDESDISRMHLVFLISVIAAAFVLSWPTILIEKTQVWHRVLDPLLMLIGLVGSIMKSWLLRVVGWIGIIWFIPVILFASPDLDHFDPALDGFPTIWRECVTVAVSITLVVSYLYLKRSATSGRGDR
jgi:hypothetical protein